MDRDYQTFQHEHRQRLLRNERRALARPAQKRRQWPAIGRLLSRIVTLTNGARRSQPVQRPANTLSLTPNPAGPQS